MQPSVQFIQFMILFIPVQKREQLWMNDAENVHHPPFLFAFHCLQVAHRKWRRRTGFSQDAALELTSDCGPSFSRTGAIIDRDFVHVNGGDLGSAEAGADAAE